MNREELTYRQSTSAVIVDKLGRILIVQKRSFKGDEWDIPGGGIEEGEEPEIAIIRELAEELGCKKFKVIKISALRDCYEWPDELIEQKIKDNKPVYRGQERKQFLVGFSGEQHEIKPQEEEIRAVKWVFPTELSRYFVFPNQMDKMKNLLKEFEINI